LIQIQSAALSGITLDPNRPPLRSVAIHLSLRTKSVLAISVLIGYLALIAIVLAKERAQLMGLALEMKACQYTVTLLEPVERALARSLVESQKILNASGPEGFRLVSFEHEGANLENLNVALQDAGVRLPALREDIDRFRRAVGSVKAVPAVHHLASVRDAGQVLLSRLHGVVLTYQTRSNDVAVRYHAKQQFIGVFAIAANVVGAVASVGVILVFFSRLARDIKRLQARAAAIVDGYDGEPLPNTRADEVGGLIEAVNRMQADLRRSERQVEIARQQRFHQEKMAAVGSLASAIGHEVSNPIAAISGVARFIAEESVEDPRPQGRQIHDFAQQILEQTERIAHIMRQLGTLTAPSSPEPELLDLSRLVRSTCGFIRYDKRFRGIEFDQVLDAGLPAITAVADHLTQILMNLLLNAADALEGITDPLRLRIRVAARTVGDAVHLTVTDHGRGMTPEVLARAFDESFTTKPPTRGRGIGLFVCKSLIEKFGGRIELASIPGEGTTATVHIPMRAAAAATGEG
jgi:two-component system, NtrC family, sensor kinase